MNENIDGESITTVALCMGWLAISLFICHIVVNKIGKIYCESILLRQGNEQILDNLDTGVMIVEEGNLENALFFNKAAKKLSFDKVSNSSEILNKTEHDF